MRSLPFLLGLMVIVGGFTYFNSETAELLPRAGQFDRYFPTPKASVDTATKLMAAGDWEALEAYYDIAGKRGELSGAAFAPFPLGAHFVSARTLDGDEVEVTVALTDSGGTESMLTYRLKAHPEGYKFLPRG